MPYTPNSTWVDGSGGGTPLSAARLNNLEAQVTALSVNPPGYEFSYNQWTTDITSAATTEGTAATFATSSSVTYDGSTIVVVEVWVPNVLNSSTDLVIYTLFDGATVLGKVQTQCTAGLNMGPCQIQRRLTPSAAAHVFTAKLHVSGGTGHAQAGAGGSGVFLPGFIRVTRA